MGSRELVREGTEGSICHQLRPERIPWIREESTDDEPPFRDKETALADQDRVRNVTEIGYSRIARRFDPYRFH